MKYIKTFNQINESNENKTLLYFINKISKNIDTKSLFNLLLPNKNLILPYYRKYYKNGIINVDMIYSDFKRLNFRANESFDYDSYKWTRSDNENNENNPILRFLYKLFIKWPKNIVIGIWNAFKETVIDEFKDSEFLMGSVGMLLWIMVTVITILIGFFTYQFAEHEFNGLKSGRVKTENFEPSHYELHTHTILIGKTTSVYTTNDYVPDKWRVSVIGENGREETWYTYNKDVANNIVGKTINNDDNWTWEDTNKK